MKNMILLFTALLIASCGRSQKTEPRLVGKNCEGCEAILEYGDKKLNAIDTLPDFEKASKKLQISGTIFETDGKTPADDVILYIHHTNEEGVYPTKGDEKGWEKRHGYLRGWVKTGKDGKFTFYTQVPGTYPSRDTPAHIHPYILEPDGKYYWLESYFFQGDPLLTDGHSEKDPQGGTSGIVTLEKKKGMFTITRNFILGRNVPNYE